jgi:hypothetical protein
MRRYEAPEPRQGPLNDSAAAVVVMSERKARDLGIQPPARIVSTGVSALSPEIMGLGPIEGSAKSSTAGSCAVAVEGLLGFSSSSYRVPTRPRLCGPSLLRAW